MDLGGFQNNGSSTERGCTSVPLSVDVGQTSPDASIMVPGELPSINIRENELRVLNTQPPTLSGEISILECDTDWASGLFNPGPLPAEPAQAQHSSANARMCLAVQSQLPVQCTSPNLSLNRAPDTLNLEVQQPAQSRIETMFTPASADQGFSQQGDGIFECQNCSEKLYSEQSPGTSDILRSHQCQRQYHTQRYENYCHSPQEQMPSKTPELVATDEYGHKYFLHGLVKHPDYAEYIKRFNSFLMMPSSVPKTPKELASAGFYFLRQPDQVACFCCGLGFGKWETHDDPCKEHACKSPNCIYVTQVLGSQSVQQQPINSSSTSIQTRTLATNGSSASFLTRTLATNGSSASIQTRTLATNGSIDNWQELPIYSISHDVSNMSLDATPSMPRGFNYQAIADMGFQPDQIKRAITNLQGKKHTGIIDTYSIVNEILEMDETKVTPRCFQCHQEMRDGYTLLPCGHVAICLKCDVTQIKVCPVCKKKVEGCVVTYPPIRH